MPAHAYAYVYIYIRSYIYGSTYIMPGQPDGDMRHVCQLGKEEFSPFELQFLCTKYLPLYIYICRNHMCIYIYIHIIDKKIYHRSYVESHVHI